MEENEKKEIGKAEKKKEAIETLTEGKTFVSDSFGNLRTAVDSYGRPVFCLKDACAILEIKNPSDASKRLRKSGVVRLKASDGRKNNSFLYITEGNLYRLIFQSRKEEAMQFVDWVTDTVLPEIRRYGRYEVKSLVSSEEAALAFLDSYEDLKTRVCILERINKETEEARLYVKRALDSGVLKDLMDIPEVLNIQGLNRKKLFAILRQEGVLDDSNMPVQKYIDSGWFRVDTHSYVDKTAGLTTHKRTFVYQSGITGIRKLLDKKAGKKNG